MADGQEKSCTSIKAIGTRVVHPTHENRAFQEWAIPVLTKQIQHPDPFFRKRALKTLVNTLYDPRRLIGKDFLDMILPLKRLSEDTDTDVRQLLIKCLAVISMSPVGRKIVMDSGLYETAGNMLQDADADVRRLANTTLRRVTLYPSSLIRLEAYIPTLLELLHPPEEEDIKALALTTLHLVCSHSLKNDHLLGCSRMLITLLGSPCPKVRQGAATVLMDSCITEAGQLEALDAGAVPILIQLCHDSNPEVVAKALGGLMMIVICIPGKKACTEIHNITTLISLLKSIHVEIRLNCLRVLTSLAENNSALKFIAPHDGLIRGLLKDPAAEVQRAAETILCVMDRRLH